MQQQSACLCLHLRGPVQWGCGGRGDLEGYRAPRNNDQGAPVASRPAPCCQWGLGGASCGADLGGCFAPHGRESRSPGPQVSNSGQGTEPTPGAGNLCSQWEPLTENKAGVESWHPSGPGRQGDVVSRARLTSCTHRHWVCGGFLSPGSPGVGSPWDHPHPDHSCLPGPVTRARPLCPLLPT